ncbi:hypothetical protein [Thalassobaculum salexigens]|uniref:hypothetical protein n=1 Tax=Thalassobaculum salexigens TaxID=455360 RepID=UPI00248F176F|nr:hypothetical protein [Thalassobaculum salexigens]
MDGISTERALLAGSISPALEAAFRTVADTDLGGGPKYAPTVMRALSRTVAARAYGKPMLELCHLLRVADAVGGRHGWPALFFGVQVARGPAFRALIQEGGRHCDAFDQDFRLESNGVTIAYPDAPFTVSYGRMGFLAALLELMVTALGYRAVDAEIRAWLDAPFEAQRAATHANALSRLFYDHLREHLSTAQSLRVFARLIAFLEASRGSGFGIDDLDDRAVMDYWYGTVTAGDDEATELRGFRMVTERVGMLRTALQAAFERHAIDTARSVGPDREAGEVDPGTVLALLEVHDEEADELRALQSEPAAAVKFLTRREVGELDLIARLGSHAGVLAVSVLRAATFGAVQSRLSQALRRHAPQAEVTGLIDLRECESYDQRLGQWRGLEGRLERMALAALAVLVEADRAEAALEVLARLPAADLSGLRDRLPSEADGSNVIALRPGGVVGMVAALADPKVVGPEVAGLIGDARKALRGVGRSGFGPEDRRSATAVNGMAAGAPLVRRLLVRLQHVRTAAEGRLSDDTFAQDTVRFRTGFRALYGGTA